MARFNEMPRAQHLELARRGGLKRPAKARPEFCIHRHRLTDNNVILVTRKSYNADRTKTYTYQTYRCKQCAAAYRERRKARLSDEKD